MDVTLATRRAPRLWASPPLVRRLLATCATAGTLSLLLLGALLLARRAAGAFERPLGGFVLLAATLVLAAACQGLHALWRSLRLPAKPALAAHAAVSFAFFCLAVALSLPASPQVPLGIMWAVLVASEGLALVAAGRAGGTLPLPRHENLTRPQPTLATPHVPQPAEWESAELPIGVTQRMVRSLEAATGEAIHGTLRETFVPAQRTANVHIAFCPPLNSTPEMVCEQVDGPEVAIKIGELAPYGARFDLRLKRASSEPAEVVLEYTALVPPANA